jgi:hypothetical protein
MPWRWLPARGQVAPACAAPRPSVPDGSPTLPRAFMLAHWAGSAAQLTLGTQNSLTRILGIWALAAAPMWILSWIVFPALSPDVASDPLRAGVVRIALLTIG